MTENLQLSHEQVDDVPLLLGLMERLGFPAILDRHLGNHGNHQGISNGWLATVWLSYILSQSDHRKSSVQEWVDDLGHTLETLTGQRLRPGIELSDDRLGIVLSRLSKESARHGIDADLWSGSMTVYDLALESVRLDSTTTYGYHTPDEDGVMQHGHSKDHRPDLPQLKLMAAAAEPSGQIIACDVHAGNAADDPLYVPLIERVRQIVGRSGLLYVGDSKMAALSTRAQIVAHQDYYLTALPLTGETAKQADTWVAVIVDGEQGGKLIWEGDELLGAGYEFQRPLRVDSAYSGAIQWNERVLVVRSTDLARQQAQGLEERLLHAEKELAGLTPAPGRGKRQISDEEALRTAIDQILQRRQVAGLLEITWQREESNVTHVVGPGRSGPNRPTHSEVQVRYQITTVQRNDAAIQARKHRLGWRFYVTNLPTTHMNLAQAAIHYRGGWSLERNFHLVKDLPLGLSPLFVRRDDQIVGLTYLLTIALRLLTLIETQVRRSLHQTNETLTGLYEGNPNRATQQPTGKRLLKAFARAKIVLTHVEISDQRLRHLTPLSPLLERILHSLGLSTKLYNQLAVNSP